MEQFTKFRTSSLDISSLGLETGSSKSSIGCTPLDAKIIAWSTEDKNLHFCMIPHLGSTVFAVDPTAPPGDTVHPVANHISDFIGLICACRSASLVARAYQYSETYFYAQRASIDISEKTTRVLKALENIYCPEMHTNPYRHMIELQKNFDYSKIPLDPSYFDICPVRPGAFKWPYSYNTGFDSIMPQKSDTKGIKLMRDFHYGEYLWCVPALYISDKGLVIDYFKKIPSEKIRNHDAIWKDRPDKTLTIADKSTRDLTNPYQCNTNVSLVINNKKVDPESSFTLQWNPYTHNSWEAQKTMDHYQLDRNSGYLIRRDCIPYKRHPNSIRTIDIVLSEDPVFVAGEDFYAPEIGKSISLTHPQTGNKHELTVIGQSNEALEPNFLSNHPCCYTMLQYTLTPPIHRDSFQIVDFEPADLWSEENDCIDGNSPIRHPSMAGYYAISSLRFEPRKNVRWQILYKLKPHQDTQVRLIP